MVAFSPFVVIDDTNIKEIFDKKKYLVDFLPKMLKYFNE